MDTGSLTERSREALQEAQNVATRMGHTEVDGEHLLLALVDQQDAGTPTARAGRRERRRPTLRSGT